MGQSYSSEAYQDIVYKHPDWQQVATDYEAKFAANLSNDAVVKEAAHGVLTKLSKMLNSYYDVQDFKKQHPEEYKNGDFSALYDLAQRNIGGEGVKVGRTLEDALLTQRENRGSAGQIGNRVQELSAEQRQDAGAVEAAHAENQAMLDEVINGEGNLREQMTLLYNGFFQNGGRKKEEIANSRSFKNMMANISEADAGMMNLAGLRLKDNETFHLAPDFAVLEEQGARKSGGDIMDTVSVAMNVASAHDKKKGRGNPFTRFWAGVARILRSTGSGRKVVNKEGFGEGYYQKLGIGLSERERNYGTKNGTETLQWQEGGRLFEMPKPVTAEGMLQVAGSSGTALRMLAAYRMMGAGKKDLLYFRLALIGWMCSSRDHTLYEVLKGSANAGVVGYENLEDAVMMYQTVDPLSPAEIRENYAPNREYPHETIYKKIVQGVAETRKGRIDEINRQNAERHPDYPYQLRLEEARRLTEILEPIRQEEAILLSEMVKVSKRRDQISRQIKERSQEQEAMPEEDASYIQDELLMLKSEKAEVDQLYAEANERHQVKYEEVMAYKRHIEGIQTELKDRGFVADIDLNQYNLFHPTIAEGRNSIETANLNAQDLALNIYTTSSYKVMNQSQKYGQGIARYIMEKYTDKKDAFKNSNARELADTAFVDQVLVALRLSNRIAQDALIERSNVSESEYQERMDRRSERGENMDYENRHGSSRYASTITTMRGGKTPGGMYGKVGDIYKTTNLTSTAKDIRTADGFYTDVAAGVDFHDYTGKEYDCVSIMEFHLNGKSGVDISKVSQFEGEGEVLLPAGTTFRITQELQEKIYDGKTLLPLTGRPKEEIDDIRYAKPNMAGRRRLKLRKHVVLEEVEGPNNTFRSEAYQRKRQTRDRKRAELAARAQAFQNLRAQRRAVQ